jgi:Chromosome segregation ATPases
VAQDLNQAKRIGYSGGGYRMVTLEGAIIEPSGKTWYIIELSGKTYRGFYQ